jgi:hypothetical protein
MNEELEENVEINNCGMLYAFIWLQRLGKIMEKKNQKKRQFGSSTS